MKGAVFLDRDGVINVERKDYVKSWDEFKFIDGAIDAISLLNRLSLQIFVITNQSAVGRLLLREDALEKIHRRMMSIIEARGGRIDSIFYCPHTPYDNCDCRKPRPGLMLQAARQFGILLRESYLVGNSREDALAAASVRSLPIILTHEKSLALNHTIDFPPETIFLPSLRSAVDYIRTQEPRLSKFASAMERDHSR